MIEPSLALQAGIRAALIASPEVSALVAPEQIGTGHMRREHLPSILMSGGQTEFLGHASGSQYVARVWIDLHIWALDAGADTAKAIGFAAHTALRNHPHLEGCTLDEFEAKQVLWLRDPAPDIAHGVLKVEAVVRWTL